MDAETSNPVRVKIEAAIACVEQVVASPAESGHEEVAEAVGHIIEVRNVVLNAVRRAELPAPRLDEANAIVSLAFGTMFPLIGVHLHRFEQARSALRSLADRI